MSIHTKVFNAKKHIGSISKDSTNPFFKSKYFDINGLLKHVQPILEENKVLITQPIIDGIVYTVLTDIETSESIESGIQLPQLNDAQKLGSAITYYRRYTLQSLLSLQSEDDDGNRAAKPEKPTLNDKQYAASLLATKDQIKNVLGKFKMTSEQRKNLETHLK